MHVRVRLLIPSKRRSMPSWAKGFLNAAAACRKSVVAAVKKEREKTRIRKKCMDSIRTYGKFLFKTDSLTNKQ